VWAKGNGNKFKSDVSVPMSWTAVDLLGVATSSPSPSVSPSPGAAVIFDHAASLSPETTLSWSVTPRGFAFRAVHEGTSWFVSRVSF
jgi:hypothetical protein